LISQPFYLKYTWSHSWRS